MLYIIATPIGNLEDITFRAKLILEEVDLVLAEDTRKSGILLKSLDIKKPFLSFHDHNEAQRISQVISELKEGKKIALISNAGTPTISDPGYKLVRECRKENLEVTSIPGPSSIINALALTSLPHDKFAFLGYMPRKAGERKKFFKSIKDWKTTLVFFESPFRLVKSLEDLKEIFGNPRVAVIREMTKRFEQVLETDLDSMIVNFKGKQPKGEIVLLVDNRNSN